MPLVIRAKRNAVGLFQCSLAENGTILYFHIFILNTKDWQYGTVRRNFCKEIRYAGTVRFFCDGMGMVRWYGTPFL